MNKIKVLLFTDKTLADEIITCTGASSFDFDSASDLGTLQEKAERNKYDIYILEQAGDNGVSSNLVKSLLNYNPDSQIILISEDKSVDETAELIEAGIYCFIPRNTDFKKLLFKWLNRLHKYYSEIVIRSTGDKEEEENIFNALIRSTSSAIFIYQDTKFVYVNSASESITGYSREELLEMNFWDIVHEDYRELIKLRGLARQKGDELPGRYEFKIIRKDGKTRWVDFTSTFIRFRHKPAALGTAFDITEIKHMLSLLSESERRYHDLSDLLPSGIFELDRRGIVTYANRYLINLFGYSLNELDNGFNGFRIIAPMDRHKAEKNLGDVMKGLSSSDTEYMGLKRDGTMFPIIIYSSPIYSNGRAAGIRGVIIDNSEKKSAEQSILLSSEKWKRTFDAISELVAIIDEAGNIIEHNKAFGTYFGSSGENLTGKSCFDVIYKYEGMDSDNPLLKSIISRNREEGEFELNGNSFLTSVHPIYSSNEEIAGYVHVMRDITEREKIREALSESEERYRLISTVASDYMFSTFKNPQGFFEMTWVVGAFEQITGYTFEEYKKIGGWRATVHPDDIEQDDKDFETLSSNMPVISEIRTIKKNGEIEWVKTYAHPIWDKKKNELHGISGAVQSITERKIAEDYLRTSEERMRVIVEGTPHLFFYTQDADANIVYISPTVEAITGYKVEQWINQKHWFTTDSEINKTARERTSRNLQGMKNIEPVQVEIKHADGYPILLEVYENPIIKDGLVLGLQGVAHNITARVKAEEEINKSREAYKQFFEDDLTGDFISSADGHLIDCNPAYLKIFGFKSKEEALSCDLRTLFHSDFSRQKLIDELLVKGKLEDYEYFLLRRDGKLIYLVSNIYAIYDADGNFTSMKGYIFDNTTRKLVELELSKLSEAVKQSPVMVVITDTNGKIEYVNPKFTAISQFAAEEVIGKDPKILNSGMNKKEIYHDLWSSILSGNDWSGELINKRKDGSFYWASVAISPLKNINGEITHFISVTEDISEKKKMFEELKESKDRAEEASKAKILFLAHMSHELRTPLVGILGYSDLLCAELKTGELYEMSKGIRRSGYRLLNTLNMILDLTRIETDKLEINFEVTDIRDALYSVYHTFKGAAHEKKLSFEILIPHEKVECLIDEHLLVIVLENLVNNAIKFTKDGSITISASKIGNSVIIKIKDTGIGIDEKYFNLIFEEFRQVSEGITRDHQGTGLGLTISKKYVEKMNGNISVDSRLGHGTEFTIQFPLI